MTIIIRSSYCLLRCPSKFWKKQSVWGWLFTDGIISRFDGINIQYVTYIVSQFPSNADTTCNLHMYLKYRYNAYVYQLQVFQLTKQCEVPVNHVKQKQETKSILSRDVMLLQKIEPTLSLLRHWENFAKLSFTRKKFHAVDIIPVYLIPLFSDTGQWFLHNIRNHTTLCNRCCTLYIRVVSSK